MKSFTASASNLPLGPGHPNIDRHRNHRIADRNTEASCNCTGMDPFTQMLLETRRDALASLKGALSNVAMIAEVVSSLNRQIDVTIGVTPTSGCLGNDPEACTELITSARRLLGDLAPSLNPPNSTAPRAPQQENASQQQQQQQQTTAHVEAPQVRVKQEPPAAPEEEPPASAPDILVDVDDSMLPQPERELVRNVVQRAPFPNSNRRSLQPMVRLGLLQDMIAEAEQEQKLREARATIKSRPERQKKRPGRPPQRRSVVERELAELEEQQREYNRRYRQRQKMIQRKDKLDSRPRRILEPTPDRQLRPARARKVSVAEVAPYVRPKARPTRSCVQQVKAKMELNGLEVSNSRGSCESSRRSSESDSGADTKTEDEAEPRESKVRPADPAGLSAPSTGPQHFGLADISDD